MKRHIHTIMLLLLVACLTCGNVVHASADIFDTDLVEQYEVAPSYKKLLSSSASIEIVESTGKVTSGMSAISRGNTDTLQVTLILQTLSHGKWEDIKTWTASGEHTITMTKYYYISQTGTYRVKSITEVYDSDGNYIESATRISASESYS